MDPLKQQIHHNLRGAEAVVRDSPHGHCNKTGEGATILNRGRRSVKFRRFVTYDKHRDLRAIFPLIPNLRGLEVIKVQSVDLGCPENAGTLCFWVCEVVASDNAGRVKSGHCEEEMRLLLSVRYRSGANKVRRQTIKPNARPGVEIYFIFGLQAAYQETKYKFKTNWDYITLVDCNKILLVDTVDLPELRILHFWDKVTNFGIFFRQVDGDNFMLGCIQVCLDVE